MRKNFVYLRIAQWLIDKVAGRPKSFAMDRETMRKQLTALWATQPIRDWLDQRERFLIDDGFERFMDGKIEKAHGIGGQVREIRNLRGLLSGAFAEEKFAKREALRQQMLETERKRV